MDEVLKFSDVMGDSTQAYQTVEDIVDRKESTICGMYLWQLSLRLGYLTNGNEGRFTDIRERLPNGEKRELDIDTQLELAREYEETMGSSQEVLTDFRRQCLNHGIKEQELRTMEKYCGISGMDDEQILEGDIEKIFSLVRYLREYVIRGY